MTSKEYAEQFEESPMAPYLGPEQIEFLALVIARAQAEAVAEEREACAQILDREADKCEWYNVALFEGVAEEIRARSTEAKK